MVKNTIKRGETFYFNVRLSEKEFYRKSLKTDSPSKARILVKEIRNKIEKRNLTVKSDIDSLIESLIKNKVNRIVRLADSVLTPLSSSAQHTFSRYYSLYEDHYIHNYNCSMHDGIKIDYPTYNSYISNELNKVSHSNPMKQFLFKETEDSVDLNEEFTFFDAFFHPSQHQARYHHLNEYVNNRAKKLSNELKNDQLTTLRVELDDLKQSFNELLPKPITTPDFKPFETSNYPLLKEVTEEFLEYMGKVKETNKQASRVTELLVTSMGELPINEVSYSHLLDFWEVFRKLPKNNKPKEWGKKDYPYSKKALTSLDRLELASNDETEIPDYCLYSGTIFKHSRAALTELFVWLTDIKQLLNKTPMPKHLENRFSIKGRVEKRVPFPEQEVLKLVTWAEENLSKSRFAWAILIMAYHGLRNSEVLNLLQDDVIEDKETGIIFLMIREGKTAAATRKVPVHQELLDKGFFEFSKRKQATETLFNFNNARFTQFYCNKIKHELELPSQTPDGGLLSLYSLRHNFVTQLATNKEDSYCKFLIGHKDITSNYTHLLREPKHLMILQQRINKIYYKL